MLDDNEVCVGIDFGTSNTCVGVYINGSVKIVPNRIGERITPSVVLFKENIKKDKNGNEIIKEDILVGEEALCESIGNIRNYIYEIKRFIGLDYEEFELSGFKNSLNYEVENIKGQPNIKITINREDKYYTIEDISGLIIKKIVQCTEDFIAETMKKKGLKIKKAFFTVPSQFTDQQKRSIQNAARIAGIEESRIINEPTAAALAYGIGRDLTYKKTNLFASTIIGDDFEVAPSASQYEKSEEKILTFDLGGGTLDLTILNVKKNKDNELEFNVILTKGDIHLGGSDFDKMLMDYCVKKFCEENNMVEEEILKDNNAFRRLKTKCESAKKILSIKNEVIIQLDNFYQEEDLFLKIKQNEFNLICEPLFKRIKDKVNEVLNEGKCSSDDIDKVILVGGATRMIGVKNLLIKIFGDKKIKDDINPDEAVAIGATLDAAKSQIQHKMNFILQDIIPFNLGVAVQNEDPKDPIKEVMNVIIPKHHKIPWSNEKSYQVNLTEENPDLIVTVYEGNNKYIKYTVKLGEFIVTDIKQKGSFIYKVMLKVDVNGKLSGFIKCDKLNIDQEIQFKKKNQMAFACGNKLKIAKNKNLETISSVAPNIKLKKDIIVKSHDINIKLSNLIECSKIYEELINNYTFFLKYNEFLYEKIFTYTQELFKLYSEIIEMKTEETKTVIKQIKERMVTLIKEQDYVENLMMIFKEIKISCKNEYYTIFINYLEILNNEGKKKLSKEKYKRYYSKLYFEKAFFSIKKFVDQDDLTVIDKNIKESYDSQKMITEEELKKLNSFAFFVETYVKEGKFLFGNTGFTYIANQIQEFKENKEPTVEEIQTILDLFHNMCDSFDENQRSIGEAYCLANIIQINFVILKVTDYEKLESYIERFLFIMEGKDGDNYGWYKDVMKIIDKINKNN